MTTTEQINAWLALEHEAVWLFPLIGARFDALLPRARSSFEAHRDTRDGLLRRLADLGAEPVSTQLTYGTSLPRKAAQAVRAARDLESRIAAACLALAGESENNLRAHAVKGLRRAALAELTWDAEPQAFPGLP